MYIRTYLPNSKNKCTTMILPRYHGDFITENILCFWDKYYSYLEIMSCQVCIYQPLHTSRSQKYLESTVQNTKIAHFSLVSLSPHPRSRRGAERIKEDEERWSRPSETALERSDLTEKSPFRESHTKAETKKTPAQSLSPQEHESFNRDKLTRMFSLGRVCYKLALE